MRPKMPKNNTLERLPETIKHGSALTISVCHSYPGLDLDIRFDAPAGVTVLFGRSGSGKSTIVNAIAGLIRPKTGRIEIAGRVLSDSDNNLWLPPHRRRLGYIFQDARLFPHLNVAQNLTYGRVFSRRQAAPMEEVVEMLGIGDLLKRRPVALSGGERQRVAIGRALLSAPDAILADEPLAALDEARKAEILPYFERLADLAKIPILYVTHSPSEVARLATTVVAIQKGRVLRQGSAAEVLSDPAITPLGARGAGAMIEARLVRHHEDGLSELEAGGCALFVPRQSHPPDTVLRLRISASDVILSRHRPEGLSALNILPGRIETIRAGDGPGAIVSLLSPAGRILARITRRSAQKLDLKVDDSLHAVIKSVAIAPDDVGGAW